MQKRTTGKQQPGSLGHRARLHGHELRLRPGHGQAGGHLADPVGRRTRRHVLRHRRGLRPVHERGAGGRSPRPLPRAGGDRHQVRVRPRPAARPPRDEGPAGPEQPAGAHQGGRRGLAQAAQGRRHRPVLSAPRRPGRAHRRRGGSREGADSGGKGQALRPLRGGGADDPPGPRGPAGRRGPERILAVDEGPRGGGAADARRTRNRLRPLQPAGQGLPHGEDGRDHQRSTAPTSATPSPASRRRR